jgi:hexosaminidase
VKKVKYPLYIVMSIVIVLSHSAAAPNPGLHLMPIPERVDPGSGRLIIDGSFTIQLSGHRDPLVLRAADRLVQRLQKRTGIPVLQPIAAADSKQAVLRIHCSGLAEPIQSAAADESYRIEVTERQAILDAPSPIGVLRGIETFLQLVDLDAQSWFIPVIKIEDRPRFRWRGLLMDVCRHWEPPEVVRRNLDAMAAAKMNVLHWHLSDDQGFRVESRKFPLLHQRGSDGKYYTQRQVREIIEYARDRGIRVIPEFDLPGHSTALLTAYPELASAPGPYQLERSFGVFDPTLDPSKKHVYDFLDSFIGEMAALFPDPCFHIGGDEVTGKQWNSSGRIRAFKARKGLNDNHDLQAYFNQELQKILAKHGKKMVGWDEILHPGLPKNVVVQSWRGQASLADGARKGYTGILSYGWYLDHMRPASFQYEMDPLGKEAANLKPEESARIIGGEACMWAEFVTPDNIDSRIWPRTAAIAERLWSPAEVKDVPDMYRRLAYMDRELDLLGLQHRSGNLEMIERMAGEQNATPLKQLSELLIPQPLGPRQRTRKYTTLTPMNRMVDAVFPESNPARLFDNLVQEYLANPSGASEAAELIRKTLACWRDNERQVKPMLEQSFLLNELQPLSRNTGELSSRALQAMDYIESEQKAPAAWKKETGELIGRAEKPQAEMLIAIVPAIKKLAEAVD